MNVPLIKFIWSQVAAVLPSKTIPLTSAGSTARRTAKSKAKKRKATNSLQAESSTLKKARHAGSVKDMLLVDEDNTPLVEGDMLPVDEKMVSEKTADVPTREDSFTFTSLVSNNKFSIFLLFNNVLKMDGKKNFIYLFYERVAADDGGVSQSNYKYYKCFHGQRKTYSVSPNMKHNLKSMSSFQPFVVET